MDWLTKIAELPQPLGRDSATQAAPLIKPKLVEGPPEWHAAEVAHQAEEEGFCVFWSDVFSEVVAFIKDDSFRSQVPAGIVIYTKQEIHTLWGGEGPSDSQLRLIHQAKKLAQARVIDFKKGTDNASPPLS